MSVLGSLWILRVGLAILAVSNVGLGVLLMDARTDAAEAETRIEVAADGGVDRINNRTRAVTSVLETVASEAGNVEGRVSDLEDRIDTLESALYGYATPLAGSDDIGDLERRVDDMEFTVRRAEGTVDCIDRYLGGLSSSFYFC